MSEINSNQKTNLLLLVIITILIPPLGVALDRGLKGQFWISLILTILLFVPGLIYSLYIILK